MDWATWVAINAATNLAATEDNAGHVVSISGLLTVLGWSLVVFGAMIGAVLVADYVSHQRQSRRDADARAADANRWANDRARGGR